MSNRFYLILIFCLTAFISCKRATVPVATSPEPEKVNRVTVHNIDYTYFTAKGRMRLESRGNNLSANFTLRMQQDSVIWVSLSPGLGIEAIRAKITRDSILILDRINQHYYAGDYDLLKEKYNVDVPFDMLQNIIIGNYTPGDPGSEKLLNEEGPIQHSRQKRGSLTIDQFIDTELFKLKRLEARDDSTNNQIAVDYQDFAQLGHWPFAHSTLIALKGSKTGTATNSAVSINHRQLSITDPSHDFPFSVPSGYTRK